jgi:hypothetical protein
MFATVYLPNFYLQAALRYEPDRAHAPVALIDGEAAKAIIIELNEAAARVGVTIGMTPSQGLARHLPLLIRTRSRAQEKLLGELLPAICVFARALCRGDCARPGDGAIY